MDHITIMSIVVSIIIGAIGVRVALFVCHQRSRWDRLSQSQRCRYRKLCRLVSFHIDTITCRQYIHVFLLLRRNGLMVLKQFPQHNEWCIWSGGCTSSDRDNESGKSLCAISGWDGPPQSWYMPYVKPKPERLCSCHGKELLIGPAIDALLKQYFGSAQPVMMSLDNDIRKRSECFNDLHMIDAVKSILKYTRLHQFDMCLHISTITITSEGMRLPADLVKLIVSYYHNSSDILIISPS